MTFWRSVSGCRLSLAVALVCASASIAAGQDVAAVNQQTQPGAPQAATGSQAAGQNGQSTSETSGRPTITAAPLGEGESITLDGRLDEPVWSRAVPVVDFMQIDPDNGSPATERTEVRIAFGVNALYIGVVCYDSEPDGVIAFQRRRDEGLGSDDKVRWTIDTFLDARSGYFFEMNPLGHMADALMGINGQNRAWDGIWEGRAHRNEMGWTLEVELPFRTFNFNPNSDTWGINFERTIQRKNEVSIWSGWARNQGLQRMTNAGLVTGLRNVTQGHGLDIKPYGVFTSQSSPGSGRSAMVGDASAGVDLFYNPTPQLRANFTVNTDFAQTEVDQRQVNLTRYSLFFPERRDFFLDGATFFDFASPEGNQGGFNNQTTFDDERILPFFSRRIGLSAGGEPQKIDFGTKLTGQMGAQDVGFLHVRTGDDGEAGAVGEDFTVVRLKRRVLQQSYIGALYTRRDARAAGSDSAHTAGIDARLATSSFLGDQNLEIGAWFLNSSRGGVTRGNSAFGAALEYPNDRWNGRVEAVEVQENFDPAVGFVTRHGYRRYTQKLDFGPRPAAHPYIRQLTFGGAMTVQTDLDNGLLQRGVEATLLQMDLHSQDNVGFFVSNRYERLDAPFEISNDITLPVGSTYTFSRYGVWGRTANRRRLSIQGRYEAGDFYSGTRAERQANVSIRVRPGLFLYLNGQWNSVKLLEGHFTTRLYRFTGETQFTPLMAVVNIIQYDSQSAVLGWQSRFRWILTPGNDLYIVYTHNWFDDPLLNRYTTIDKRAASKILYTYRF
jgi:hypothetical protein